MRMDVKGLAVSHRLSAVSGFRHTERAYYLGNGIDAILQAVRPLHIESRV